MPHKMEWYIQYQILQSHFWGPCTDQDTIDFTTAAVHFLTESQIHAPGRLIYNVMDATKIESMPPIYLMLPRAIPTMHFKNRGPLYLVTRQSNIRRIFELTAHIMAFNLRFFNHWDEAIQAAEAAVSRDSSHTLAQPFEQDSRQ